MRRCSSSRRGVLSSNCSDRVNSPRLIEWRDERLRGAIAIGAAILPPSAKAGWSTALADLKRWESGKLELSVIPSRGRPRRRTHNRVCPARGVPSQSCRRTLISCLGREWREARQRIGQGYLGYPNCEGLPRWRGAPEPFVLLLAYSVSPERTPPVAHEAPSRGRGWRPRKGSSRQLRTLGERGAPRRDAAQTNWARGDPQPGRVRETTAKCGRFRGDITGFRRRLVSHSARRAVARRGVRDARGHGRKSA